MLPDPLPADMDEFWVFGYGSLMWNPGFPFEERRIARVHGYHRSLCIFSWVHRGTEEAPGLVLGLDRGGSCKGAAFSIRREDRKDVLDYLRARELVTNVYLERVVPLTFQDDGRRINAVAYVVDRTHRQYAAGVGIDEAARIVAMAEGQSGRNVDYVLNTVSHLRELGIRDHRVEAVAARLKAVQTAG